MRLWDPVKFFEAGLKEKTAIKENCTPQSLCICIELAIYATKVKPEFLPKNKIKMIKIEKREKNLYRLIIPFVFTKDMVTVPRKYQKAKFIIIDCMDKIQISYRQFYYDKKWQKQMSLSSLSPLNRPLRILITEAKYFFKRMSKSHHYFD